MLPSSIACIFGIGIEMTDLRGEVREVIVSYLTYII